MRKPITSKNTGVDVQIWKISAIAFPVLCLVAVLVQLGPNKKNVNLPKNPLLETDACITSHHLTVIVTALKPKEN